MKNRTTILLLVLFFGGLAGLWLAELARIPTAEDRKLRSVRVLPELIDVPPTAIGRVEILGGPERLVFERRDHDWRLIEPTDAAADRSRVEALIQTLKNLPKPQGAVPLTGKPSEYGLQPPVRTIRLFGDDPETPLAALEVGKEARDGRYVRPAGSREVEVADAPPFAAIEQPATAWRDRNLVRTPSFDVARIAIESPDHHLAVSREGDRWRVTDPINAPASTPKIDGLLGSLTALRVIDGPEGFVKNSVKDFAPYGLNDPAWTIRVAGLKTDEIPEDVVQIGKEVPDHPGDFYARRSDSEDVVIVRGALLDAIETDPRGLRSHRVADLDPSQVDLIRIEAGDAEHLLIRQGDGWQVARPVAGPADSHLVDGLIAELNELVISDLIDPEQAVHSGLESPSAVITVWEGGRPADGEKATTEPRGKPRLELQLGRRDAGARVLFAREAGDPAILALPFEALEQPFGDRLAFLDHRILPELTDPIRRVVIQRDGLAVALKASEKLRDFANWRMVEPVEAAVDPRAVAMLDTALANLRADRLIEEGTVDRHAHGFDSPFLIVTWTTGSGTEDGWEHTLILGEPVFEGARARFAMVEEAPLLFTLGPRLIAVFEAEFHDRNVLSFDPANVERLVFRGDGREAAYRRTRKPFTGGTEWTPEPDSSPSRINPSEIDRFLASLGALQAVRFRQYQGTIPSETGLDATALTITIDLKSGLGTRQLRLGNADGDALRLATTATGLSGPVFLVPEPGQPWIAPFRESEAADQELPADPFVSGP